MSEELGESSEVAQELLAEHATESSGGHLLPWVSHTAISTLVMAMFSAIGALLAGITANEALLDRTEAIIEVVDRDRDQIELEILTAKHDILAALGKEPDSDEARIAKERRSIDDLTDEVTEDDAEVESTMKKHELFAIGVTLLSIAITLCGLAVVAKRKQIWHFGLVIGTGGIAFVIYAMVLMVSA